MESDPLLVFFQAITGSVQLLLKHPMLLLLESSAKWDIFGMGMF